MKRRALTWALSGLIGLGSVIGLTNDAHSEDRLKKKSHSQEIVHDLLDHVLKETMGIDYEHAMESIKENEIFIEKKGAKNKQRFKYTRPSKNLPRGVIYLKKRMRSCGDIKKSLNNIVLSGDNKKTLRFKTEYGKFYDEFPIDSIALIKFNNKGPMHDSANEAGALDTVYFKDGTVIEGIELEGDSISTTFYCNGEYRQGSVPERNIDIMYFEGTGRTKETQAAEKVRKAAKEKIQKEKKYSYSIDLQAESSLYENNRRTLHILTSRLEKFGAKKVIAQRKSKGAELKEDAIITFEMEGNRKDIEKSMDIIFSLGEYVIGPLIHKESTHIIGRTKPRPVKFHDENYGDLDYYNGFFEKHEGPKKDFYDGWDYLKFDTSRGKVVVLKVPNIVVKKEVEDVKLNDLGRLELKVSPKKEKWLNKIYSRHHNTILQEKGKNCSFALILDDKLISDFDIEGSKYEGLNILPNRAYNSPFQKKALEIVMDYVTLNNDLNAIYIKPIEN